MKIENGKLFLTAKKIRVFFLCLFLILNFQLSITPAAALEQQFGSNNFRIDANASAGLLAGGDTFASYALRLQLSRTISSQWSTGLVYSFDERSVEGGKFAKDAFSYVEMRHGRTELGWTESIAAKLALRLPDVGGTRLNNAPFFLNDDFVGITNPAVRGNQYAWRANVATTPGLPFQFGIGRTVLPMETFESSTDAGIRYRNPNGRFKTSASLGLSYIEKPNGMKSDDYLPRVYADARYQATLGYNVQFGSLLWAATFKATADENPDPDKFNTEGLQAGTGFSYEFMKWAASVNYIFSAVGIWREEAPNMNAHTGILSLRYKITKNFDIWGSGGAVRAVEYEDYFLALGLGVKF